MAPEVALPNAGNLMYFVAGVLAALPVPLWYAAERLRGFSRALFSRLPYEPPPGKEEQEAMEEAMQEAGEGPENQNQSE